MTTSYRSYHFFIIEQRLDGQAEFRAHTRTWGLISSVDLHEEESVVTAAMRASQSRLAVKWRLVAKCFTSCA